MVPILISQEIFYWTQVTRNNFGVLPISISYGSPGELRIYRVVIFLPSSDTEQEIHTNTSKYGVWESTKSMDMLNLRILMIDHIEAI